MAVFPTVVRQKGADSEDVLVISDALANIEPKPEQWLDKDFFQNRKG